MSLSFASAVTVAVACSSIVRASPGNRLWYKTWGDDWYFNYLPVGNGYQGMMQSSRPDYDDIQLNLESLWAGGPTVDPNYRGGNPTTQLAKSTLDQIRATVWANGTASLVPLMVDAAGYGSLTSAGALHLSRTLDTNVTSYTRELDLNKGIAKAAWSEGSTSYTRTYFCSYPDEACGVDTVASKTPTAPTTYFFDTLRNYTTVTCFDSKTLLFRGEAEAGGLDYEILARLLSDGKVECAEATAGNATLTASGKRQTLLWTGATEYDINKGTPATGYTFKGPDPHGVALRTLKAATSKGGNGVFATGVADYSALFDGFELDVGHVVDNEHTTAELVTSYNVDQGNSYLEWLVFNLGRFFIISGNRGVLPPGLQAVWTTGLWAPWSGDYHANINLQMMTWGVQETNLGAATPPLWDYIQKTWMPRGAETAKLLYHSRGFTTHNEMNIYGHTGMKLWDDPSTPQWANYPAAAAWMMQHVWDGLDFTGDVAWFRRQGYPIIKGVAEFWLDNLFEDEASKDGTLVVNPCNSPENPRVQPPTYGCSHWQQQIWEVFNDVLKGAPLAGEKDAAFLEEVKTKVAKMDRGIRVGSWGQLQEWKRDLDSPTDLHRHISHLIGLSPGYAIASYNGTSPSRAEVLAAATKTLLSRGPGIADEDPGWAKMHRSLLYGSLANSTGALYHYKLAIARDFQTNLFSMYAGKQTHLFQADANYGAVGAAINMIVQAHNTPSFNDPLVIKLLPALPASWAASGSVRNARVRGGVGVSIKWKQGKITSASLSFDKLGFRKQVQVFVDGKVVKTFTAPKAGTVRII